MATLLDTLQARLAGGDQQSQSPNPAQPLDLESILQAKRGKAGLDQGGMQASNVVGGVGQDQITQSVAQQQQQGALDAQQLGTQQQQVQTDLATKQAQLNTNQQLNTAATAAQGTMQLGQIQSTVDLANQQRQASTSLKVQQISDNATLAVQKLAADSQVTMDDIFANVKQENATLAQRTDASQLEQKAFVLAISDKKYLQEIQNIGTAQELTNSINFAKEAQTLAFGNQLSSAMQKINLQIPYDANQRVINQQIAQISDGEIIQLAQAAAASTNMESQYKAAGTIGAAGAKAAVYTKTDTTTTDATTTTAATSPASAANQMEGQ